jgi:Zn-dependent peptidase ImmA (M78 family)/DNA-binding XRE family transcriptional regulator
MNRTINGDRIKQAREIKGYTQADLAERIGKSQSTIAHLERNSKQFLLQPSDDIVEAIALQTGFPVGFFYQESGPEFPLGSLLYRSRHSTLKREDKHRFHQLGRLIYEIAEKLADQVTPIEVRIPKIVNEDPLIAARVTRAKLGLSPDTPIRNLLNQIEKNGVFVFAIPYEIDEQDGYSGWADSNPRRPVIVITGGKPGDRQRFTLAHELGHLVMHHTFPRGLSKVESEADIFASELLLPEDAMRREIDPPVTLTTLAELKPRWGVSIAALIMRAKGLEIVTERQARYLFVQLAREEWDKQEPENLKIESEKPRALKRMAEVLHGVPVNRQKVAAYNMASLSLITEILNAHADKPEASKAIKKTPANGNVIQLKARRGYQRTPHALPATVQHMGIDHCSAHVLVTEQFLNCANVRSRFKQMRSETMTPIPHAE